MFAKQLSVFIENRKGRLEEVLDVLKENDINVISLSLADTTEYGLLRLIVNDPIKGKDALKEAGFSTMLTDVLVVKVSHVAGSLQHVLKPLSDAGVNVEYMYGLTTEKQSAAIVIKVSDAEKAAAILTKLNVETLSDGDVKKF